jgi:acetyl-CoA acetyltransferase
MAKLAKSIVILGARRTAFGTMQGALKGVSATDLAVHACKAALAQSGVALDAVGHVIVGNVMQTSADAIYCARHVGLKAGLPSRRPRSRSTACAARVSRPSSTVPSSCSSVTRRWCSSQARRT